MVTLRAALPLRQVWKATKAPGAKGPHPLVLPAANPEVLSGS